MDCTEGNEMTRFEKLVAHLKAAQPFRRRLVVRRVEMVDDGSTSISDSFRVITITVNSKLPFAAAKDALIHEWGHAAELDDWEPHGANWGKHHAAAYQAWEEFLESGH